MHQVPSKSVHCKKSYREKKTRRGLKIGVFCTQKSRGIPTLKRNYINILQITDTQNKIKNKNNY